MKQRNVRRRRVTGKKGTKKENNERYRDKALRKRRKKARRHMIFTGIMFCLIAVLAVRVVSLSLNITDVKSQINSKQSQIKDLDAEYTALKNQQQGSVTLSEVETYAENQLGLVRIDRSQEEYVSVEKPDEVEVTEGKGGMEKLATGFVRSFNAILSFLR